MLLLHRDRDSKGFAPLKQDAQEGGAVAGRTRRDIVALKPWPMNADDPESFAVGGLPPAMSKAQQKHVASKLRKSYMKAGFKPLFRGSSHLFLTHFDRPSVTDLIEKMDNQEGKRC